MIHKLISTLGFGILGIDPITAVYMITMGLRKDKKSKISLFWFSFAGLSALFGSVLAVIWGASAIDFLESIVPGDNSPFWAILELGISVFILVYVCRKIFVRKKKSHEAKKPVEGSALKYLFTGGLFAISCFTDPTYYAVILLGAETNDFLLATLLFGVWFIISQFMAVAVYIAIQLNLLKKLIDLVERMKEKNLKFLKPIFYIVLIVVSIVLITDSAFYAFNGYYWF